MLICGLISFWKIIREKRSILVCMGVTRLSEVFYAKGLTYFYFVH